jgi:hypothetical protein
MAAIRLGEKFGFHQAGPVGQSQEFHRLAGDLMVDALFHHQPTSHHFLANMRAQVRHGGSRCPKLLIVKQDELPNLCCEGLDVLHQELRLATLRLRHRPESIQSCFKAAGLDL